MLPRRLRSLAPILAVAVPLGLAFLFGADDAVPDSAAPPTVAQAGVTNAASHLPPFVSGGSIARGSLFRIQGWRMGPAQAVHAHSQPEPTLAGVRVQILKDGVNLDAPLLMVSSEEIQAVMPENATPGNAELRVVRNGNQSRRAAPVQVVDSSFGAFSRNGRGWGPGEIRNHDGRPNSAEHPALPGESVRLLGTGLGPATAPAELEILAGGKTVTRIETAGPSSEGPSIDQIEFDLPSDTPPACYVPIRVRNRQGFVSNTVTLAVSRNGAPCSGPRQTLQRGPMALITLLGMDLRVDLGTPEELHLPIDLGYLSFLADGRVEGNPLLMLPPPETCVTLNDTIDLKSILQSLIVQSNNSGAAADRDVNVQIEGLVGKQVLLDAGPEVIIDGPRGRRNLNRSSAANMRYSAVLGGLTPGQRPLLQVPLFLTPGRYQISAPGGKDLGAFHTALRVPGAIRWKNQLKTRVVDRKLGTTVTWKPARQDALVLILAINSDVGTNAFGACACVERARIGHFQVPPDAVANIPPTPEPAGDLPLSFLFLAEIPGSLPAGIAGLGVESPLAFFASVRGQSVAFR